MPFLPIFYYYMVFTFGRPPHLQAGSVSASKSVKIQQLSKIMILHLMRFSYGSRGSTKLHKPVHFPLDLVLGRELLASPTSEVILFLTRFFIPVECIHFKISMSYVQVFKLILATLLRGIWHAGYNLVKA